MAAFWRRFILLVAIAFWQGGFMFYGGVVVPVGGKVLGSEADQGFITQAVTNYLNLAGGVCLIVWGGTLWFDTQHVPKWRWQCWALWWLLVLGLAGLEPLHLLMDRLLDSSTRSILNDRQFRLLHRIYLMTSTAHWVGSLALLGVMLKLWQTADHRDDPS
jgi:hypothetical protein